MGTERRNVCLYPQDTFLLGNLMKFPRIYPGRTDFMSYNAMSETSSGY